MAIGMTVTFMFKKTKSPKNIFGASINEQKNEDDKDHHQQDNGGLFSSVMEYFRKEEEKEKNFVDETQDRISEESEKIRQQISKLLTPLNDDAELEAEAEKRKKEGSWWGFKRFFGVK